MNKAEYVKSQPQTREHSCRWPGCHIQVPPFLWGCPKHWYMLPKSIRKKIWDAYRPGQEEDLDISKEYHQAANEAQEWINKSIKPI